MRRPRLKAPEHFASAIYHCVSRVVDRRKVLMDEEKEHFVRLMRIYERLYGLKVITFCIMGNHFHILVEVPQRPEVLPNDAGLVALVEATKGKSEAFWLNEWLEKWRAEGNHAAAEQERERYFRRMWDVSQFMKVLKQRFSQWFNGRQPVRRKGTLWEERFRSVLVEDGLALRAVAAYIDLNPIRAGLVGDPADYRWSGYGEASAGQVVARKGLRRLIDEGGGGAKGRNEGKAEDDNQGTTSAASTSEGEFLSWYRMDLFGRGHERRDDEGAVVKAGFSDGQIEAVEASGGATPLSDYLRRRVRYFTDGAVLGTRTFVNSIFEAKRKWFGVGRKTGARTLRGLGRASPLRTLRALGRDATGP